MSDTTGGRLAHVVVDSATVEAGPMSAMLPDSMTHIKPGTAYHFFLVRGKPAEGYTPGGLGEGEVNMASAQIVPGIQLLFLAGAHDIAVGTSWVDSVRTDSTMTAGNTGAQVHTNILSTTTWSVTGKSGDDFVVDGVTAGTTIMNMMGNEIQGTTTGTEHLVISPRGVLQSALTESRAHMTMLIGNNSVETMVALTNTLTILP